MKIVYFSPHPNLNLSSPSGSGTHMREVIQAFENEGHQVVRLIMGGEEASHHSGIAFDNPWYKKLVKYFLPVIAWQTIKDYGLLRYDRRARKKLHSLIQREQPDVIYERGYYLMKSGLEVARSLSIPLIIELNAPYPEEKITFEGKSLYLDRADRIEHLQVASADGVVVVSSALRDYLGKKYPRSKEKIIVTPNAINPRMAVSDEKEMASLRTSLRIAPGERVIGFVGSIFRYHGVDRLLESFLRLVRDNHEKNVKLIIIGDGIVLPELRAFAEKNGLSHLVHFAGNVPHAKVYDYIGIMDITIMASSNWYGSPVKVFEYGAMKKAIIAPDNVPLRDVMENEIDGLLIGNGKDEVVNALSRLLNDEPLKARLSGNFHTKVMSHYTWKHVVNPVQVAMNNTIQQRREVQKLIPGWNKRVLALRTDFSHHGTDSGYKQVLKYINPRYVLGFREGEEDLYTKAKIRYQWLFEFDIYPFRKQIDLIHVMYGEDYLRFTPYLYPRIPVVATFHQPPEILEIEITSGKTRGQVGQYTHWLTRSRFRKLSAAIVTEGNQKKVLARVMPEERIHIVPLGVHLEKFHSLYRKLREEGELPGKNDIITVGNWMRDWKFYIEVLEKSLREHPDWVFHLVNRKLDSEMEQRLESFNNVRIHKNLDDIALKKLLYRSRVHFLPVTGASGNNALMEGLAMGCPAVMTDMVSESFPLRSESVLLYPKGDLESAMNMLSDALSMDDTAHLQLKESTFARSIPYDWKDIALRTLNIYQTITK